MEKQMKNQMEMKNISGGRKAGLRWILTCMTLFWMLFIFAMSSAGKDESNSQSGAICEIICEYFVEGYEEMPEEEQIHLQEKISFPVRKCAHLTEYAILGILMSLTAASWREADERNEKNYEKGHENSRDRLKDLPVLGTGFLYAVSDEIHQIYVPGRSGELRDILIDTCGVLIGICAVRVLQTAIRNDKNKETIKKEKEEKEKKKKKNEHKKCS